MSKLLKASAFCAAVAVPFSGALAQDMPGDGTTINMARASWNTGWFQAEVYRQLFQELGYDVDVPITVDVPLFYLAVAQGDADLWLNGWFPLHNAYEGTFSQGAEVFGYVAEGGALEGYLVDAAAAEEFNIQTLDDFKRPEVQAAFDRDGDGLADMVACPPGWGCELVIEHHLDAFDLRDHINPIKAGYTPAMADAIAAFEAGEHILFYTWTPNWTVDILTPGEEVVWIEVPFSDLPADQADMEDATTMAGIAGCVADPCNLGFPANDIRPVVNSEFLAANPAVAALLDAVRIPLNDIFSQNKEMFDGADTEEDITAQAASWIEANRQDVDGWLEAAHAAAM